MGTDMTANSDEDVLDELFAVIQQRQDELPEGSYTTELLTHEKGVDYPLEKLGEETTEFLLAVKDDDQSAVAAEAADVVYHLLVALAAADVTLEDLRGALKDRR